MINVTNTKSGYQIHITNVEFLTIDRTLPLDTAIQYIAAMSQAYRLSIAPLSRDTYNAMVYTQMNRRFQAACK